MRIKANEAIYDMNLKNVILKVNAWGMKEKENFCHKGAMHTQVHRVNEKVHIISGASYHMEFLCLNLWIEVNKTIYDIKSEKHDVESQTSKLVRQITNAHTRACFLIRICTGASYDIEF